MTCARPQRARPCDTCPWIVGNTSGPIPRFEAERALRLPKTTDAGFVALMACHGSTEDNNIVCAGWLASQIARGLPNISLRIAVMRGRIDLDALDVRGLNLHPDFPAMLRGIGLDPDE